MGWEEHRFLSQLAWVHSNKLVRELIPPDPHVYTMICVHKHTHTHTHIIATQKKSYLSITRHTLHSWDPETLGRIAHTRRSESGEGSSVL